MEGYLIFAYTRKEALEDGVLVDVSVLAKEAGYRWPVALTSRLYQEYIVPSPSMADSGQSETGRLWDLLTMLRLAILRSKENSQLSFSVLFVMQNEAESILVDLVSVCGPGDDGSPVLTVMLPDED
jgi:hypothetical protein